MSTDESTYKVQLLGMATIGPKGQVVIPAAAREKMSVKPGDKLVSLYVPHKDSVAFVPESRLGHILERLGEHVEDVSQIIE